MDNKNGDIHTREEIEDDLLVADYVAGKLDDEARAALEARIRDDDDLLARVIEERGFRSHPDDEEPAAPAGAAEAGQAGQATGAADEPVKRASPWRLAATAAVLVAAATVVFYNQSSEEPGPTDMTIVPVLESNRVRIIFSETASESDRSAVAEELGVDIAYGPLEMNAYVGVADRVLSRDELMHWLDDPRVTLVEPIQLRDAP